jgi:Transposase IS66 family
MRGCGSRAPRRGTVRQVHVWGRAARPVWDMWVGAGPCLRLPTTSSSPRPQPARLSALVTQRPGVHSSDGALANRFRRVHARWDDRGEDILTRLRSSRLIGRDETGARGHGRTPWAWVFQQAAACGPVMRPRRGQGVIQAILGAHRRTLGVSALYSAQRHHPAEDRQVWVARQW